VLWRFGKIKHNWLVKNLAPTIPNKKSPANAKGNVQQRCMLENSEKQNLSSSILAMMFL